MPVVLRYVEMTLSSWESDQAWIVPLRFASAVCVKFTAILVRS